MTEALAWPPTKVDLERLYLVERLSAAKIAKAYGLKYKNPKVGESTVLYHLKRNGIERRDTAEHVRKVTEEMVDEWVVRYLTGESLKRIAEDLVDPVTVWNHLKARGLVLRDKVEAQIKAVTKYERKPFNGDSIEKAYLMGLRYGDLHVVKHGRAVRVRVSTTHPAMAELFEGLFSPYGLVHRYPRRARLVGFEWTLECDLNESFTFLLMKPNLGEISELSPEEFRAFLAGFFDAEGSIFLHEKYSGPMPEVQIRNKDFELLRIARSRLDSLGIAAKLIHAKQDPHRLGRNTEGEIWSLAVWRFDSVRATLSLLPLRHQEKVEKARIALRFVSPPSKSSNRILVSQWETMSAAFEENRLVFLREAETAIARKEFRININLSPERT